MAYRLNRKLVLEMPARMPDGAGGFTESWIALGVRWANIHMRSGREKAGVTGPLSLVSCVITVRAAPYHSDSRPQADQRFREGARLYRILSVAEDDTDARYLRCMAQEEVAA